MFLSLLRTSARPRSPPGPAADSASLSADPPRPPPPLTTTTTAGAGEAAALRPPLLARAASIAAAVACPRLAAIAAAAAPSTAVPAAARGPSGGSGERAVEGARGIRPLPPAAAGTTEGETTAAEVVEEAAHPGRGGQGSLAEASMPLAAWGRAGEDPGAERRTLEGGTSRLTTTTITEEAASAHVTFAQRTETRRRRQSSEKGKDKNICFFKKSFHYLMWNQEASR